MKSAARTNGYSMMTWRIVPANLRFIVKGTIVQTALPNDGLFGALVMVTLRSRDVVRAEDY